MTGKYTSFGYGDPETWEGEEPYPEEDDLSEDESEEYWLATTSPNPNNEDR